MLMPYSSYILYSPSKDRYYIGHTQDPLKRLTEHNCRYEKSTAPYIPWTLIGFIEKQSKSEAYVLEMKLKNLNRPDLQRFIKKYFNSSS
ncbi:MAG: GIY-YIG nuclease family protein [Saprospiraceae bacterium]|nr:GIY-YIG nuclease family protein [Saprospiraceae bacterium]